MTSSRVEITFNDGNGDWDNNINDNYACTPPGTYAFVNQVTKIESDSDCVEIVDKNSKILRFQQVEDQRSVPDDHNRTGIERCHRLAKKEG
ncbi:hypothetical protein L916_19198 [Phytophthora nicotianae]|uniref:Carbohydrate binding module family 25 domain-containing protein n=4 Tax=Phytophthora nicotianae TaxID=4792 RepID=V9E3D8_PHYNI|nr:hypothetical protein F443_19854 [Phytophthora nicotianae P1569]ETL27231.1 hypothetical protein L916_19198 [Phytophthora nicotianae]ETO62233.1 hypothetical protein F444_19842 [Phytophthora nicotianae P1976]